MFKNSEHNSCHVLSAGRGKRSAHEGYKYNAEQCVMSTATPWLQFCCLNFPNWHAGTLPSATQHLGQEPNSSDTTASLLQVRTLGEGQQKIVCVTCTSICDTYIHTYRKRRIISFSLNLWGHIDTYIDLLYTCVCSLVFSSCKNAMICKMSHY